MKGKRFQTTEEIRLATERELLKITHADFQQCKTMSQTMAKLRQCRWQIYQM